MKRKRKGWLDISSDEMIELAMRDYTADDVAIMRQHDHILNSFAAVIHLMIEVDFDKGYIKHFLGQLMLYGYELGSEAPALDAEIWKQ